MNDNETIADVLAAMRFDATTRDQFDSAYIVDFCERFEAAHKREVGNRAALREVCIYALAELEHFRKYNDSRLHICDIVHVGNAKHALKAALSATATAEESSAVGDAAKLREALEFCVKGMCGFCRMDAEARGMTTECVHGCEALLKAKAALAEPPRNCDKVKTSWDVLKEWHEGLDTANDIVRMLDWLLAPATEHEGENDGNE